MPISDVVLSEEQCGELSSVAQSRSLPAGYVFRARLILMLAEGASFNAIKRQLHTTAPTISRWKARFLDSGMDGLDTHHPGQSASVLTPALRARILSATRKKPVDGSTHWSCRKLAATLGVSKYAVHRTWKEAGLKPHRLERYMASNDPDFESKTADIIGLYLNPPRHAAVFCVDEKTAIQALDRLDPVLPLSPDVPSATDLSTTAMEHCPCMQPWTRALGGFTAKPPPATPAASLSPCSRKSFRCAPGTSRFTSSWTICRLTKPPWCASSCNTNRGFHSISPLPSRHGLTRSSCGSPGSNGT